MVEQIEIRQIETIVRHIFPSTSLVVERVAEGISTRVYRITARSEVFYLRVLPEEGASFAPEVAIHAQLRQRKVSVPEVIYFEYFNDLLQRSIMITTEIKGQPLSQSASLPEEARERILAGDHLIGTRSTNWKCCVRTLLSLANPVYKFLPAL